MKKQKRPLLVAEVKTKSPFGYVAKKSFDEQFDFADEHGDIISIHTDPRWGGSFNFIREYRRRTKKPILAKGIHATDDQVMRAFEAGADYVLVVGRIPHRPLCVKNSVWIEGVSPAAAFPECPLVINSRSLITGRKLDLNLSGYFGAGHRVIQASFIRSIKDVDPRAWGVIVGEHLEEYVRSLKR